MNTVVDSNISPGFGFEMALTKRKKIKAKSANLEGRKGGRMKKALDYGKQNEEKAFEAYKATCKGDYVRNSGLRVSHG